MAKQNENGDWVDNQGFVQTSELQARQNDYNTNNPSGGSGGGGGGGGAIGVLMGGGAAGGFLLFVCLLPLIGALIFEGLMRLFFKFKTVGRIIQSVIFGTAIGYVLFFSVLKITGSSSGFFSVILVAISFGVPALWYYTSHYFTLKAIMHDERFKGRFQVEPKSGGIIPWLISKLVSCMFAFPLTIFWYGIIPAMAVGGKAGNVVGLALFIAPIVIAAYIYAKKALRAKECADTIKSEEKKHPIGLVVALVFTCFIPLVWETASAADEKEKVQTIEFAQQLKGGESIVVTKNAEIVPEPRVPMADEYNSWMEKVVKVEAGNILNVTGEPQSIEIFKSTHWYIPVEYQGTKGWIQTEYIGPKK